MTAKKQKVEEEAAAPATSEGIGHWQAERIGAAKWRVRQAEMAVEDAKAHLAVAKAHLAGLQG